MATLLNTRIRLRYDTYTNWHDMNPVLLEGEVAIAVPGTEFGNEGQKTGTASCLMKVGNGSAHFNTLPWLSAVAADVHTWAKKSEAEFKTWLTSVEGPALATASEVATISGKVTTLEGKVKTLEETTVPGINGEIEGAKERLTAAEEDIVKLQAAVGEDAEGLGAAVAELKGRMDVVEQGVEDNASAISANDGKITANTNAITEITKENGTIDTKVKAEADRALAVEGRLEDAIEVLNGADTVNGSVAKTVKEAVANEATRIDSVVSALDIKVNGIQTTAENADTLSKSNKAALDILNGTAETEGSVRYAAADVVNTLIGGADNADTITNVKTLIDYVNANGSELSELTTTVSSHTETLSAQAAKILALEEKDGAHDTAIQEINNKLGTATLVTTNKTLFEALNEVHNKVVTDDATTLQSAKDYADQQIAALSTGDGVIADLTSRVSANETKLSGINGTVLAAIEAAETRAKEEAATKASAAQSAAEANAAADATAKANTAETNAKNYTDTKIGEVNSALSAEAKAREDFDKTALTGTIDEDSLTIKLNGLALDLVLVCGNAN